MMTAQADRHVSGSRIEHRYLAVIAGNFAFRERRREVRNTVVERRNEIHCVFTTGACVIECVVSTRIGPNRVEWSSAIRPDAVQDYPRATDRVHVLRARAHDAPGNLLRSRGQRGLQKKQAGQTTY